LLSSFNSG